MSVIAGGNTTREPRNKAVYGRSLSVKALLRNPEGQLLLLKDKGTPWWDLPGGHVEDGETLVDALRRELEEEIGIRLVEDRGSGYEFVRQVGQPRELKMGDGTRPVVFFSVEPGAEVLQDFEVGDEHEGFEWLDPREMEIVGEDQADDESYKPLGAFADVFTYQAKSRAGQPCRRGERSDLTGCVKRKKKPAKKRSKKEKQKQTSKGRERLAQLRAGAKIQKELFSDIELDIPEDGVDLSEVGELELPGDDWSALLEQGDSPAATAQAALATETTLGVETAVELAQDPEVVDAAQEAAVEMSEEAAAAGFDPTPEEREQLGEAFAALPNVPPAQAAKQRHSAVMAAISAGARGTGNILAWCGRTALNAISTAARVGFDALPEVAMGAIRMTAYAATLGGNFIASAPIGAVLGAGAAAATLGSGGLVVGAVAGAGLNMANAFLQLPERFGDPPSRAAMNSRFELMNIMGKAIISGRGMQNVVEGLREGWQQLKGERGWGDVDVMPDAATPGQFATAGEVLSEFSTDPTDRLSPEQGAQLGELTAELGAVENVLGQKGVDRNRRRRLQRKRAALRADIADLRGEPATRAARPTRPVGGEPSLRPAEHRAPRRRATFARGQKCGPGQNPRRDGCIAASQWDAAVAKLGGAREKLEAQEQPISERASAAFKAAREKVGEIAGEIREDPKQLAKVWDAINPAALAAREVLQGAGVPEGMATWGSRVAAILDTLIPGLPAGSAPLIAGALIARPRKTVDAIKGKLEQLGEERQASRNAEAIARKERARERVEQRRQAKETA